MEPMSFGVSVMTDKPSYAEGELIMMTLTVFNDDAEQTVTFHFSSAQRYDFVIEDDTGIKVWRWSDERIFAQVLGQEMVGLGQKELTYSATYEGKLTPSSYKVTGILRSQDKPMSEGISIMVK